MTDDPSAAAGRRIAVGGRSSPYDRPVDLIERHRLTWIGRADGVAVKTFMPRFPGHLPMTMARDGTWWVDLMIPSTARIEYRIEFRRGVEYETTLDPANPVVATNPFGHNSVLTGSRYAAHDQDSTIDWRRTEFRVPSPALGGRRHHHLLTPVGIPDRERLPLVLLHDGTDYDTHAALRAVVGTAITRGHLPFLRLALLEPRRRNEEYPASTAHAEHVAVEVLGHLRQRIGVSNQVIAAGASLGAVASWHLAWQHPGTVTGLVLQSGTFAFGSHREIPPTMARSLGTFLDEALADPRLQGVAVGQTCGRYESLIDWNRAVAAVLSARAAAHSYEERWTGHDWGAWSDTLPAALMAAFTGPGAPPAP